MAVWTVERIEELCIEYCGRCRVEFSSPVIINGRLKSTLGRCTHTKINGEWQPTKIEISRQLLETATDQCIMDVIAHECAHYVAAYLTCEMHGHDATFKRYCAMIGTSNDTPCFENLQRKVSNEETYKYTLYCTKCGKFVCGRHRACTVTKRPLDCRTNCCNAPIKVRKNWQERK